MQSEEQKDGKTAEDVDPTLVVCPSGLQGRFRKMKLAEMELLGDRKKVQSGEAYAAVLAACWTETVEVGPGYKVFSWEDALQGDRFAALIALRRFTHGDTMEFDLQCQGCRRPINWPINLAALKVKPYPTEALHRHARGDLFTAVVGGTRVSFRLMTGKLERQMQKAILQDKEKMVASWTFRLIEVEGLEDPRDKKLIRAWVSNLDADLALELREKVDEVTGGVDTTLQLDCPYHDCEHHQEVELPLGAPGFWTPKKRGSGASAKPSKTDAS